MVCIINTFIKDKRMMIKVWNTYIAGFTMLGFWWFIRDTSWAITEIINTLCSYKLMRFNL